MRVKGGTTLKRRHKKVLKSAKGYWMTRSKLYKVANQAVMHAGQYSYAHRRRKPSQMRRVWITRLSAATKENGSSYRAFIDMLKKNKVELDRKVLSDIAYKNPEVFSKFFAFFKAEK